MLIEFRVKNFRSIKDEVVLSMLSVPAQKDLLNATFEIGKTGQRLSKTTAIYGGNASGKTNIWNALLTMWQLVNQSVNDVQGANLANQVIPFLLNDQGAKHPSEFEITFLLDESIYKYGIIANKKTILEEWLKLVGPTSIKPIFTRKNNNFELGSGFKKEVKNFDAWKASTRENSLFLSAGATVNVDLPLRVFNWFNDLGIVKATSNQLYEQFTQTNFDKIGKEKILKLLQSADLGIEDIIRREIEVKKEQIPEQFRSFLTSDAETIKANNFLSVHKKYNEKGTEAGRVDFDLFSQESEGTIKLFNLAGPIINTLENGKILFIDEFESKLHPLLLESIVRLFSGPMNKKNAQLIFCVHNTYLLQNKSVRRDQIWFTDKDKFGGTRLYSLADFGPRMDDSLEKKYLNGIFGAIPYIEDLEI